MLGVTKPNKGHITSCVLKVFTKAASWKIDAAWWCR